jgi:predicted amidohydrolase
LIIDQDGEVLEECRKNDIAVHDLNLSGLGKTRQSMTRRRPETYGRLSEPMDK